MTPNPFPEAQEGNSTPVVIQSSVKIEPPKLFGSISYEDVDSRIFSMRLYFHAKN